ncbi:MAG: glycosyl hydrolase 115 family protein [Bacteroidales bacterium]
MKGSIRFPGVITAMLLFVTTGSFHCRAAVDTDSVQIVTVHRAEGMFTLAASGNSAPMLISSDDWPGVVRAYKDLQADIGRVTGTTPAMHFDKPARSKEIVIAGTIGKSRIIDKLIKKGRISVDDISGKWECYLIQTVTDPLPGVKKALVIAGSDKRGTIYGIYEISRQTGVSPWHWWADVPVRKSDVLYISPGRYVSDEPSVKYRGIFLNDEYPALTRWVSFKYGDVTPSADPPVPPGVANYGSEFYSRIFEVLLRLKANYLWPAMWNNAFNEDDLRNAGLADEYGIVMGTSHQEPMIRAQKEWDRRYRSTLGSWSWTDHSDTLVKFWRDGIRRNKDYESILTIGLRGADDTEMGPGGPAGNIAKLEKIVDTQRRLIAEEIDPDATRVPQMWCLYKEVQDYYHAGMRVPDDVTLLWAEDNWGNVRRLPTAEERKRSGGAGVYYHFDYHGGPRSYQWINTSPIPKIWDQLSLAKQYGADRIWIVNVGHFRGYEVPMEYFLSLAYNTDAHTSDGMSEWTTRWASRQFGPEHAEEIGEIITSYTKFNGRRKPELLSPFTWSITNYSEAARVTGDYNRLLVRAGAIKNTLPDEMQDAYFHLVLFPVRACALLNELYVAAGKNALYASQGRATAGTMADLTEELFRADTTLMGYYNRIYAGGRWKHFMDQAHLGYLNWADPPVNSLRAIKLQRPEVPVAASLGVAVEGSAKAWPGAEEAPLLPPFDVFNRQARYIEVFNRGAEPFEFTVESDNPWITLSHNSGTVTGQQRIEVQVDWSLITYGKHEGTVRVRGTGSEVRVKVTAFNPAEPQPSTVEGFVEADGYVSMEAASYTANIDTDERYWEWVEDYGRTLSGLRATAVTDAPPAVPGKDAPLLEYKMYLFSAGEFETVLHVAPSLNFLPDRDFRIGLSLDDTEPQIITVVPKEFNAENGNREWEKTVMDATRFVKGKVSVTEPGYHTLKIWMIDPGIVLEKIVVNTGGLRPSYLGPPESFFQATGSRGVRVMR